MSKTLDVVERSVWTLIQGGTGVATVTALGLPAWAAAPVAAALAVVKNVLTKAAPVVETIATDVAKAAPVVERVATQVADTAAQVQSGLHAG